MKNNHTIDDNSLQDLLDKAAEQQEKLLTQLLTALEIIRSEISPKINIRMIALFLRIAIPEKIHMKSLVKSMGIPQGSLSRNIDMFRDKYKDGDGLDLLYTEDNPDNRSEKFVFLTERGQMLKQILVNVRS